MTFCPPEPSSSFVAVPCPPAGAQAAHLATGLCLPDDTPIAVILEEDTTPGATPTALGWTNLLTGAFTAGSPPAGSHPCGVDKLTELGAVLCDFQPDGTISGTALLEITYDDDGAVVSTRLIDPVTGNVYTPTGVLRPCEEPCTKCDTVVLCDNTSVPASQFVASTKVMMDTPNVVGSDGWSITGYNTGNVPSVQLGNGCPSGTGPPVPVPYPAFYMADWCAAYLAACGTADAGGSGCALNPGPALGVTSTAEGVGCAGGPDFQTACARYVMEKTFNTDAACTQIRVTSQRFRADGSAKVLVDGQDTGIFGQYNVSSPDGTIILNVAPGVHTMTVDWRDAGSPTWVQGGLTIECLAITPASTTSIEFLRTTCRTCSGSVLSVTDTTLDGQTPYVPAGTVVVCDPSAGNVVPPCASCETHTLIDKVVGLDGQISCTAFLHKVCFNCDGTISSTKDTLLDGTSPYTPTGTVALSCDTPTFEDQVVCIVIAGVTQEGFRREVGNPNGTTTVTFLGANGATVVPDSWVPGPCPLRGVETQKVCDLGSATTLIARYLFDENGTIVNTLYYSLDGTGPVGPIGPLSEGGCCDPFDLGESCYDSGGGIIRRVRGERRCDPSAPPAFTLFFYDTETGVLIPSPAFVDCPAESFDFEEEILCDNNGPFIRRYTYVNGTVSATTNFNLAGAAYVPVGPVVVCPQTVTITPEFDVEIVTLCDDNGGFLRRFTYDENTGLPTTVVTTDFAGNAYVPVGTVKVCDQTITVNEFNTELEFLCDSGTTTFLRRYIFNEATGAIGATADFTLAGAAYVPAGAVTSGPCNQPVTVSNFPANQPVTVTNIPHVVVDNFPAAVVELDSETQIMCDSNGPTSFLRQYTFNETTGAITGHSDFTLAGAAYTAVGTVTAGSCVAAAATELDSSTQFMCDNGTTTFVRRYAFNEATGAFVSIGDFTLAGAPYVPAGPVTSGACVAANVQDDVELIEHCDTVGSVHTTFYKRLVFDKTGTLLSTTNIDASGAVYVPTGTVTVGECSTCCPFNAGTGCTNTGSGTYVSIRNADGTFSLIDPVTGSAVLAANVVACPATTVVQTATTVDETIARQTGAGSVAIAAGARSVTLVSLTGAPTVAIAGSTTTAVPAGVTLTWAVDSNSQTLLKAFTFTGAASDDFIVTTTR